MEDIYNITSYSDQELYAILDLTNPTDRELEAKILHMIWKYDNFGNSSGDRLVIFFKEIYNHFFEDPVVEGFEPGAEPETELVIETTQSPATADTVELKQSVDYKSDVLNPVFKETTKRIVSIDSRYRNKSTVTTDYTFNLSTILKDVVKLKLYSIQIPYTWYTINSNFGSNFLYLKGQSPGIIGSEYDIKVEIPVGNYTAEELIMAVNNSFQALKTNAEYTDISFGNTIVTYDYPSSKATITIDIKKTYTESDYRFSFDFWTSPNDTTTTDGGFIVSDRTQSIPAFLGYNYQTYETNVIKSNAVLPLLSNSVEDDATSRYSLDSSNNYFTIIQSSTNRFQIKLDLPDGNYSRSQLFTALNTQLALETRLIDSSMNRFDVTDELNPKFGNSYYSLRIKLNRKTDQNLNSKVQIEFPTLNGVWGSAFAFEYSSYNLSDIIAESPAPQSIITIQSEPYINFKCKRPYFNGRTDTGNIITGSTILNDFRFGNTSVNSIQNNSYSLTAYVTEIDRVLNLSNNINTINTSLSINNSISNFKIDILKSFPTNFWLLDVSNNFLRNRGFNGTEPIQINGLPYSDLSSSDFIIDLSTNPTKIEGTPYTTSTTIIDASAIILTIKPKPTTDNNYIPNYVLQNTTQLSTDDVRIVATRINSLFNAFTDTSGKRVLAGSTVTFRQSFGSTKLILNIVVNSELTEEDFIVEFVDPSANVISSRLVACIDKPNLAYSDDNGETWIGTTFSDRVNSINYGATQWVASARGGNTLAYSNDGGITWTGLGNTIFSVSSNKAVWNGNDMWIATGEGGNTLAKSIDGINWIGLGAATFTTRANGIAWNEINKIWVATGESSDVSGNTLAYSTDGSSWTGLGKSIFTTRCNDVAYNATNKYVAVGEGTNTIANSTDGINWFGSGTVTFSSAGLAVTTNSASGGFIAVGAGGNTIAESTDGTNWTGTGTGTGTVLLDEAYGIGWDSGNRIIASIKISETIGDFIYSDTSGNTIWNPSNQPSVFSDHANDTAYNGTIWVGTGQGNGNTLAYSQNDATTWIGLGKTVFSISSNKVAWNGSIWIATGEGGNTLAKSTDGINWTGLGAVTFTTRANGIAWDNSNNTWVAMGESTDVSGNTLAYSTDNGTTWTGLGKSVFSTGGTSAFWNGYIWVATGEGDNTIAMSYNGIDWTGKGNAIISNKANDVVWHDTKSTWVVVGDGGIGGNTIATSYNGINWTGRGKTTFTTKGSAVTLDGSGNFVAVGEGDNTIATSSDGNTWTKQETSINFLIPRYGIGWDMKTIGENQAFYDVSNSWVDNLKLKKSTYLLSDPEYNNDGENWSSIMGTGVLESDTIDITNTNNMNGITITPLPNTPGLTTSNNSNTIYLKIPPKTYTREQLIAEINNQFQNTTITNGGQAIASDSLISVSTDTNTGLEYRLEYIKIALDINKTYNSSDYKIVFYDPYSFVHSCTGLNNTTNTSWDSTLGWILGYHEATEYDLSTNPSITGDNVVSVNIYNYFMILLDDYNNNHMNDGVVTTTKAETDFKLPLYANRALSTIDPITGNVIVSGISTNGTQMTQNQLYASQAVVDQNKSTLSTIKYSSGPFAKNVFGLIPMNISNQVNNTVYIDYGTSLQDQERSYFGPVNIQRMSVKLINDKGEIVNLNGADWSFSFICEQLYQNSRV